MATNLAERFYTPEEYLALERKAEYRSEYIDGRIYAMPPSNRWHSLITGNIGASIHLQLRGQPCEVYMVSLRVRVHEPAMYAYPDVAALCGEAQLEDKHLDTLLNPSVIIEVLSESTERYDRGAKFMHYRRLESLQEYVLVSQQRPLVERYVRHGTEWVLTEISDLEQGVLTLESIGCAVALRDIYERVEFTEDADDRGPQSPRR
jgi:Uma2 family endonuclease